METFALIIFMLILIVPGLLLVAQFSRILGSAPSEDERASVQRRRDEVARRRFDARRMNPHGETEALRADSRDRLAADNITSPDDPITK